MPMRSHCLFLLVALLGCDRSPDPAEQQAGGMARQGMAASFDTAGLRSLAVPAEFERGKVLFEANCASCQGEAALGTTQGPRHLRGALLPAQLAAVFRSHTARRRSAPPIFPVMGAGSA